MDGCGTRWLTGRGNNVDGCGTTRWLTGRGNNVDECGTTRWLTGRGNIVDGCGTRRLTGRGNIVDGCGIRCLTGRENIMDKCGREDKCRQVGIRHYFPVIEQPVEVYRWNTMSLFESIRVHRNYDVTRHGLVVTRNS